MPFKIDRSTFLFQCSDDFKLVALSKCEWLEDEINKAMKITDLILTLNLLLGYE